MSKHRIAYIETHPIQYKAHFFKKLAARREIDLTVYFFSDWGSKEYLDPQFGKKIKWDTDLLEGYRNFFLKNFSPRPDPSTFFGTLNPGIVSELIRKKYDAVIIGGYNVLSHYFAYAGALLGGSPVFFAGDTAIRSRHFLPSDLVKKPLLGALFSATSAFLTVGTRSEQFYESFGIKKDKFFFCPLTVDNDFFIAESDRLRKEKESSKATLGIPPEMPVILFVGKLADHKKPGDLLSAYEGLREKAALVFVGEGAQRRLLEERACAKGLQRVFFPGFVNQTELPKFYALGDIFVLPSSYELNPLVFNEAMCCALPVVASDAICSVIDCVKEGENGGVFRCGDIAGLKDKLDTLLGDGELRAKMGRASREMIKSRHPSVAVNGVVEACRAHAKKR